MARLAGYLNLSAMLFHNLLDDRQPDSGACFSRFLGLPGPVKLMKDLLHFFLVHADSLVGDGDSDMGLLAMRANSDLGPLRRVFHRVGQ